MHDHTILRASHRILAALIFLVTAHCAAADQHGDAATREETAQAFDSTLRFYEQTVEVVLADAATAATANVSILPLLGGKKWAVTCRWDDDNPVANAKLSAVMKQHGIRGTFYLDGFGIFAQRTTALNPAMQQDTDKGRTALKQLIGDVLADGNSIGSHGWTHALPGLLNKNRIFEEFMRNRVQLESISDSPVMSHALAFNAYGNLFEPSLSGKVMANSLFRAGIYGMALWEDNHHWPLLVPSPYTISSDGDKPDKVRANIQRVMADPQILATEPCMQFSIHPGGHQDADNEGKCFDLLANNPDYWYCTQNEYAAYRTQLRLTKITTTVAGAVLKVTVSRPCVDSLNDATPITIAIDGTTASNIRDIRLAGSTIERQDAGNQVRFNLPHDPTQQLPSKIDWLANEDNARAVEARTCASADFPGISAILWKDGEQLTWVLRNGTGAALTDIHASYHLPVAYRIPATSIAVDALATGADLMRTAALVPASQDPKDHWGIGFFAVEVDFSQGGRRGRLHLTASVKDLVQLDASYPGNHFSRIGPIPKDQYVPQMAEDIAAGKRHEVTLKNGTVLKAEPITMTPERVALMTDLDPETVFATGGAYMSRWAGDVNANEGIWIYRSCVISDKSETAILWPTPLLYGVPGNALPNKKTVYLNGVKLPPYDAVCTLKAEKNDLLIVYETAPLSIENIAFFCRLAARPPGRNPPWTGLEPRLTSIVYTLPTE